MERVRTEIRQQHREALLARAALMRPLALAPNRCEQVGVAVLMVNGDLFGGINSVAGSQCAEGDALAGIVQRRLKLRDVVAIAVDGQNVCWNCLEQLCFVDTVGDPILVFHQVDGGVTTLTITGSPVDRDPAFLVSVQTVLPPP